LTITTPIDYVTAAQAWVLSHARLVLTILALVALLVGAWWLLRKALESLKPEGEADVQRALRAWRVIARASRNPTMPRELRTSGNERVEERGSVRISVDDRGLNDPVNHDDDDVHTNQRYHRLPEASPAEAKGGGWG
jgi:hypothetical protein